MAKEKMIQIVSECMICGEKKRWKEKLSDHPQVTEDGMKLKKTFHLCNLCTKGMNKKRIQKIEKKLINLHIAKMVYDEIKDNLIAGIVQMERTGVL